MPDTIVGALEECLEAYPRLEDLCGEGEALELAPGGNRPAEGGSEDMRGNCRRRQDFTIRLQLFALNELERMYNARLAEHLQSWAAGLSRNNLRLPEGCHFEALRVFGGAGSPAPGRQDMQMYEICGELTYEQERAGWHG